MRIEEEKTKTLKYKSIIDILCNKCGESLCIDHEQLGCKWLKGCRISPSFESGSSKDGDIHEFELCDSCYDEFIESFKHSPKFY